MSFIFTIFNYSLLFLLMLLSKQHLQLLILLFYYYIRFFYNYLLSRVMLYVLKLNFEIS